MEDCVLGKSVVEVGSHLCEHLTVNGSITEGVEENIVNLCFRE